MLTDIDLFGLAVTYLLGISRAGFHGIPARPASDTVFICRSHPAGSNSCR